MSRVRLGLKGCRMKRIKKNLNGLYYGVLRQLYDMIGENNAKSSLSIRLLK